MTTSHFALIFKQDNLSFGVHCRFIIAICKKYNLPAQHYSNVIEQDQNRERGTTQLIILLLQRTCVPLLGFGHKKWYSLRTAKLVPIHNMRSHRSIKEIIPFQFNGHGTLPASPKCTIVSVNSLLHTTHMRPVP